MVLLISCNIRVKGRSNPAYGIQFNRHYFGSCYDYNVCNASSDVLDPNCGRSLMHHDHSAGMDCARLSANNTQYPQDISFDLYGTSCNRLTTWRDPSLAASPERIKIKIEVIGTPTGAIILQAESSSEYHRYVFGPGEPTELPLHKDTAIPHKWRLSGGSGASVKSVKITEYSNTLMEVNFASLFQCINLCSEIATQALGIDMAKVSLAYLSMNEAQPCGKLSSIDVLEADGNITSGREMCTNHFTATNFSELESIVVELNSTNCPYRRARVHVIGDFVDGNGRALDLRPFRGLQLFSEEESAEIQSAHFMVRARSELQIKNFK